MRRKITDCTIQKSCLTYWSWTTSATRCIKLCVDASQKEPCVYHNRRRQSVQQIYKAPAFRLFCYTALSSWNCAQQSWTSSWTIIHMWMMSHAFLTLFGQKTRLILFLVFHQQCPQSSTCFIMHSHFPLTWTLINVIVSWPIGVQTYDSLPVVEEVFTFAAAIHLVRRTSSEL